MAMTKTTSSPSPYKYLVREFKNGRNYFKINMKGVASKRYTDEREAAIAIDKILISKGKEPVNILVKKT